LVVVGAGPPPYLRPTPAGGATPQSDLQREAVLAGGKEKDLALRAVGEWHEQASLLDVPAGIDPEGNVVRPAEGIARWNEANQRLIKTLLELEKHVERKIR
jgi:hypothetical protein